MSRFTPDMEDVSAFTPIYKKGTYEILIKSLGTYAGEQKEEAASDPKKASYVDVEGTKLSVGVQLRLQMIGQVDSRGNVDGSDIEDQQVAQNTLWLHNKGSLEMTKRVLMAIFGYEGKEQEDEFNQFYKDNDFGFDVEVGDEGQYVVELGSAWKQLENKRVRVQLSEGKGKRDGNDVPEQKFGAWSPAGQGAAV